LGKKGEKLTSERKASSIPSSWIVHEEMKNFDESPEDDLRRDPDVRSNALEEDLEKTSERR